MGPAMGPDGRTTLDLFVAEANRQLTVCNSCRYCEGFCAVFPALERRMVLEDGDISQIANLCHDCRACFDACMYSPPHEFGLNIPRALAQVRVETYASYVWPRTVPRLLAGVRGILLAAVAATALVIGVALACSGPRALVADRPGPSSPYDVIPYGALLALAGLPALYSVVVMAAAGRNYWRHVGGAPGRLRLAPIGRAVWDALTLRYLRGGGEDCYYPRDDQPSPLRRHLHGAVAYGFGLCLLSTMSAAVLQDFLGVDPPYGVFSVPVVSGTVGGIAMVAGTTGLLVLKSRSSPTTSVATMTAKDYRLLIALDYLALSGLATVLTRSTPAFGLMFLAHMAAVVLTFAVVPYSKLVHVVYRFLALVRDSLEAAAARAKEDALTAAARPDGH